MCKIDWPPRGATQATLQFVAVKQSTNSWWSVRQSVGSPDHVHKGKQ